MERMERREEERGKGREATRILLEGKLQIR